MNTEEINKFIQDLAFPYGIGLDITSQDDHIRRGCNYFLQIKYSTRCIGFFIADVSSEDVFKNFVRRAFLELIVEYNYQKNPLLEAYGEVLK